MTRHWGRQARKTGMTALKLTGAALLAVVANVAASAQTVNPGTNSITTNPITTLTLPQQPEIAVSPASPGTAPGSFGNETTGSNPLTGLPCTGEGSLAVSGAGGLADTASPPVGSSPTTPELPTITSVFGSPSTLGSC
jgi:hypothetical protein